MHALAFTLRGRAPPEQHAQFLWIAETVARHTNELRGNLCLIGALNLFDPRPGRHTKSPRLLTVLLARNLLSWPASTINAVFSPSSYPHSDSLPTQARRWVRSGCFDALSGLPMAPIKEHAISAFGAAFPPARQNLAANEPPIPPPRRKLAKPKSAAHEILQPKPRKQAAKALSDNAEQSERPLLSAPPAMPVRGLAVPPLPPIRAPAPISLHEDLTQSPFVRQLHPMLTKAAIATGFSVKEFIAGMIADAVQRKARLSPLAPSPFLQVLSRASLDVPTSLVPHAMFIQRTLYDLAKLLPTRASLQAPAVVIRPIKPKAATPGD